MPLEQYLLSAVTSLYPFNKKHVTIISICPICPSVYLKASNISKLKWSDICAPWRPSLHPDLELPPWGGVPKVHKLSHWPCCTLWRATTSQARTHRPGPKPKCLAPISELSARGCALETLPVSLSLLPFWFFSSSRPIVFVKWFDTNRRRSGNTSSEIPKDLCLYSDYTEKNWFRMFALHWSFLKPTFYYSFFIYLHSLHVERKVIYSNAQLAKCFYTTVQNSQLFWVL